MERDTTAVRCIRVMLCVIIFNFSAKMCVHAQEYYNQSQRFLKANSVWILGPPGGYLYNNPASIDFNTVPPTTLAGNTLSGEEGFASVADPVTGDLLFYSNGAQCLNANNVVMPNGNNLLGNGTVGVSTTQGVCIVPFINEPGKYYLFSLCGYTNWALAEPVPDTFLYYSVVDMSLDGGLGDIVLGQKNIPISFGTPLSESMIAVPGDNCDVWLIVHDYINPAFRAFHITRDGVDPDPVISATGEQLQGIAQQGAYAVGSMAVTPDRRMLGITSTSLILGAGEATGILLSEFNPVTGDVYNSVRIGGDLNPYSLAFSPDNSKLYCVNRNPVDIWGTSTVEQYSIATYDSATITNTASVVASLPFTPAGYLRQYNGKVYVSPTFGFVDLINWAPNENIYVINQPNQTGTACDVQSMGYNFGGNVICLPNEVVYAFPADTVSAKEDTIICVKNGEYDHISLAAPEGYYGYEWDDGSEEGTRAIIAPGVYWVLCKDSCHSLLDSFIVQAVDIPLDLGNDTILCNGALLTMDATVPAGSYLWQDSSTDSQYYTTDSGLYWVQVTASGCTVSDTLQVTTIDVRQNLGEDIILCKGEEFQAPVVLTAHVPDGAAIEWSNGSNDTFLSVQDTGVYWVTVTSDVCIGTDTLNIAGVVCECQLRLPNAFSPNGDGLNDVFKPIIESGCPVQGYVLTIYNRYGSRVYSGYRVEEGWNGYYGNGQQADVGTYTYEVKFTGGTKQIPYYYSGDVTLMR